MRNSDVELRDGELRERFRRCGPNLFIVGAMKSGTSSLHECLAQHPEIFMSATKEPAFFQLDDDMPSGKAARRGVWNDVDLYLSLFKGGEYARYRGESTTDYTKAPHCGCAAARILAYQPEARIIYMMRDPVKRAISHYWWNVSHEEEVHVPLVALQQDSRYVDVSRYSMQIEPYMKAFGAHRVFALTFEEFVSDSEACMAKLFAWLGVVMPDSETIRVARANPTPDVVVQARVGGWRGKVLNGSVASMFGSLVPRAMKRAIRSTLERRIERKSVDLVDAEAYLRGELRGEIDRLGQLLGREFPQWG